MKTIDLKFQSLKKNGKLSKPRPNPMAFETFIEAVNKYFSLHNPFTIWEGFWGEPIGLALNDKLIAIQIPYDDPEDWERFRIKFMTPPHLTKKLVDAIKDGKVVRLNTD